MTSPFITLTALAAASALLAGCAVYEPAPVYGATPYYYEPVPVYAQPAPVYMQPAPVYVQPAPVYIEPPVSLRFNFGYWSGGGGHHGHHGLGWRGFGHGRGGWHR